MFHSLKKSFKARRDLQERRPSNSIETGGSTSSVESPSPTPTFPQPRSPNTGDTTLKPLSLRENNRSSSRERKHDPLGLQVLHDPGNGRTTDIIFVHGLGGTSRLSWSYNRDISLCWPKEWLPDETQLKSARILTFGYDANFLWQRSDVLNVSDFAKDLLLQMKFGNDESVKALELGRVPIIFVVHSMGGLVVKKAYILGYNDPQFHDILDTVCSIVFLATPHRGSGMAEVLNRFLLASFQSSKHYIRDLQQSSDRIREINDQFRLHAPRLQIVSFFETQPCKIGPKKIMVVERDSAILDYPGEISSPLNADHHTICKYSSKRDPNYVRVRDVIASLVSRFKDKVRKRSLSNYSRLSNKSLLVSGLESERPTEDLDARLERYVSGSCDWVFNDPSVRSWFDTQALFPLILHITGLPGSGKSILASFLIQELESRGCSVQFFFFRHDDQAKRSIRNCILSLAYQVALCVPEYARRLVILLEEKPHFARSDIREIWQKLFMTILPKVQLDEPLYWVIDAVDESESVQSFLNLIHLLRQYRLSIHVVFLTRPQTVTRQFERLKATLPSERFSHVPMSTPEQSLALYIDQELHYAPWSGSFKHHVTSLLLQKCRGNFLWLYLVIKELLDCDTKESIERALQETPTELVDIYTRMESTLSKDLKPIDRKLSKIIVSWVTCSERQMSTEDFMEALQPDFPILDLKHTIGRICGDFVIIDKKNMVSVIHHTAKEYLLHDSAQGLSVNEADAHQALFDKCLTVLLDPKTRIRLKSQGCSGLLQYATLSWSHHLSRSGVLAQDLFQRLALFFRGRAVLTWINAVGMMGSLRTLVVTAKNLSTFVDKRRKLEAEHSPMVQPLAEMELISQWSTELIRLVGKFGDRLLNYPNSINYLIPQLCPPGSTIGRQFCQQNSPDIRIEGLSNPFWDDSIAKFSVGHDCQPTAIICLQDHFAIQAKDDTVNLYHTSTFQEARKFQNDGLILAINFNQEEDRLVTCGSKTVTVWDVLSARRVYTFNNPQGARAVSAAFSKDSTRITICCDDSSIRYQQLEHKENWVILDREAEDDPQYGAGRGTPSTTSFNHDGTQIAVAFRGTPLVVWSTDTGHVIGKCQRVSEKTKSRQELWSYAQRLTWNPVTEQVVGLYNDGILFKWYPLDAESQEIETSLTATEVACSPDGKFVVTASGNGSLRVWSFDNFSLLYHLSCTSPVTNMTISPNGRRILDLRESFCNIWEPNSLIRLAEADDNASETSSSHADSVNLSLASEASAVILEPITSLASSDTTAAFCYCNDAGVLTYVTGDGSRDVEVKEGFMGSTHMALAPDNSILATAELDGSINIRQIIGTGADPLPTKFDGTSEGVVQQLLFDAQNKFLVVQCSLFTNVWSLSQEEIITSRPNGKHLGFWVQHPFSDTQLICISPLGLSVYSLPELTFTRSWLFDFTKVESAAADVAPMLSRRPSASYPMSPGETASSVDKAILSRDKSRVFIQFSKTSPQGRRIIHFSLLDTAFLTIGELSGGPPSILLLEPLPNAVLGQLEILLGLIDDGVITGQPKWAFIPSDNSADSCSLVYIDHDFWICSWAINRSEATHLRRHYFLPRDWINIDCLELARVTHDGRLLCPRNGELAVVVNGLKHEWTE